MGVRPVTGSLVGLITKYDGSENAVAVAETLPFDMVCHYAVLLWLPDLTR
jgi:hypothetical protein